MPEEANLDLGLEANLEPWVLCPFYRWHKWSRLLGFGGAISSLFLASSASQLPTGEGQ